MQNNMTGGIPGVVPPEQAINLSPEELKNNIDRGLEMVENKRKNIDTTEIIGNNKVEEIRSGIIKYFFDMLKSFGVDPNDQESIRNFIIDLEQKSPDLADLFDFIFNELFKTPGEGAETGVPPTMSLGMQPPGSAVPGPMGQAPTDRFAGLMQGMAGAMPPTGNTPPEGVPGQTPQMMPPAGPEGIPAEPGAIPEEQPMI